MQESAKMPGEDTCQVELMKPGVLISDEQAKRWIHDSLDKNKS